ncbi:MAG TPA: 30S ribosomal protein S4 [Candidatus Sabulitectum sp.]|nr:30S ribosomal protein S4 [Candidatus Sabulitectum sp.]HPF33017.1 30S ribosomal protein S4 [Candidatus Sabulitectum sp.]HPJ28470.1 30S ribosomal protein S4 [Candidatus Sabulitectum sp.]HPR23150.1 30S ribosomal protein S4 [Candidatus Sabulitectum sp.]
MSRFRGSRLKKVRSLGTELPGLVRKEPKSTNSPGEQGVMRRRRRVSTFRLQLQEKQKIRFNYGLSEKALRRYYTDATSMKGETGVNLLQLIEKRLDNVVARGGFAPTIPAARQLVSHGHIKVNGRKVSIPSFQVKVGDVVTVKEKSKDLKIITEHIAAGSGIGVPSFLEADPKKRTITVKALPAREDIPIEVSERAVVEFYSK